MDEASTMNDKSTMEQEDKRNYYPYQWIKQEPNSAIIKLEAETTNDQPGKCQLLKVEIPHL